MNLNDAPSWPDPFLRWGDGPRSRSRIPFNFVSLPRAISAECILNSLLGAAQAWDHTPNDRCALFTLAAALIASPAEVFVAKMKRLSILPPDGADPSTAFLATASNDPDLDCKWGTFERSESAIFLRFKSLRLILDTTCGASNLDRAYNLHLPNLAVHYSDHEFNVFTVRMLRAYLPDWSDDHARLKLLSMGLDAVKRQLDPKYRYWEDLTQWLEGTSFYRRSKNLPTP